LLRQGAEGVSPFVVLILSATPADRLLAARQWSDGFARGAPQYTHEPWTPQRPIRLGYISHDLRGDVVGWLLPELIERHDRSRFVANAYCYGPDDGGDARRRLAAGVDSFAALTDLDDAAAAGRIHGDGIDLLAERTGHH